MITPFSYLICDDEKVFQTFSLMLYGNRIFVYIIYIIHASLKYDSLYIEAAE